MWKYGRQLSMTNYRLVIKLPVMKSSNKIDRIGDVIYLKNYEYGVIIIK